MAPRCCRRLAGLLLPVLLLLLGSAVANAHSNGTPGFLCPSSAPASTRLGRECLAQNDRPVAACPSGSLAHGRRLPLAMMMAPAASSTAGAAASATTTTKTIYVTGGAQHRRAVCDAVAGALGWPVLAEVGTAAALAGTRGQQAVVPVDDAVLGGKDGLDFLVAQPVVVNLVEEQDFAAGEGSAAHLRRKASRFDVAVGAPAAGGDAVSAEEAARSVARVAKLSGGFGDGTVDKDLDLDLGADTFFLSLTYPDVRECLDILPGLERGVDALELRVDLLRDTSPWAVLRQVAILKAASALPVIYTVRSKDQCGAFPDDPPAIFKLLALGLRAGVELLDVEACWDRPTRDALLDEAWRAYRGTTRLLGSYHVVGKPTTDEQAAKIFRECYHDGRVDAVKVVLTAMSVRDSYRVHELAAATGLPCPIVALCLGERGKLSRVLNSRYTPVTSKLLPFVAAPGQLTSEEIMTLRRDLGMVPPAAFCLLGHPISKSPSPAMHNAAFQHCLLPHQYTLCETEDVEDFRARCRAADFGGASVTIPHKQAVMPLLDRVEPSAQGIGAVNTVVVERDAVTGKVTLVGHNTDWKGIVKPVARRLQEAGRGVTGPDGKPRVALVVGGGGTALAAAYAMTSMGLKLLVFNRTPSRAQEVADRFGGAVLAELTPAAVEAATGGRQAHVDVVVSTIPSTAEFKLPEAFLAAKPVVMDVAYRPAETALLAQARAAGCPFVQGAEMLIGQGVEQFQLWTKRRAPEVVMRAAVYGTVEELK